ncbi:hypothetical protein RclHR1_20970001 [Rhizophagus clarus]|uniref:Uncharacterized protein n=1 Tax=Rhizophagus clarus TaxID=94130 RepID=A0A2Z6R4T0_9GLOM|nr:hypothetical protein RclHR1_20970001 [Rhizophagus clarus]GES96140.1 hypothetical protein RCL_jg475.t1 [Rhizophagus clarus]
MSGVLSQQTNIPNTLISLIVYMILRVYSDILTSQDSIAEISFLLEKKVGDMVSHEISYKDKNLVNSSILYQDTQQTFFKSVPDAQQSLPKSPVQPNNMQIFFDADTVLPPLYLVIQILN